MKNYKITIEFTCLDDEMEMSFYCPSNVRRFLAQMVDDYSPIKIKSEMGNIELMPLNEAFRTCPEPYDSVSDIIYDYVDFMEALSKGKNIKEAIKHCPDIEFFEDKELKEAIK